MIENSLDLSLFFSSKQASIKFSKHFKSLVPTIILPDYIMMSLGVERMYLSLRDFSKSIIIDSRLYCFDKIRMFQTINTIIGDVDGITIDVDNSEEVFEEIIEKFYMRKSCSIDLFVICSKSKFGIENSNSYINKINKLFKYGFNSFILKEETYNELKKLNVLYNKKIYLDSNKLLFNDMINISPNDVIDYEFLENLNSDVNFYKIGSLSLVLKDRNIFDSENENRIEEAVDFLLKSKKRRLEKFLKNLKSNN